MCDIQVSEESRLALQKDAERTGRLQTFFLSTQLAQSLNFRTGLESKSNRNISKQDQIWRSEDQKIGRLED